MPHHRREGSELKGISMAGLMLLVATVCSGCSGTAQSSTERIEPAKIAAYTLSEDNMEQGFYSQGLGLNNGYVEKSVNASEAAKENVASSPFRYFRSNLRSKPEGVKPDAAYMEWRKQVEAVMGDSPYTLPAYHPEVGPLQLVYCISPAGYSLDLYRSRSGAYEVQTELSGLHTAHDFYYSYSRQDDRRIPSDFKLSSLARNIDKVQEGNISIYGLSHMEGTGVWKETIMALLGFRDIESAQVIITQMENHTNVDLYSVNGSHSVSLSFSVQNAGELNDYLNNSLIF